MQVYLVRHGETGGNVAHRHQAEHTRLTKAGQAQAEAVAKRVAELEPTHLVSSSLVRAIETAKVISERVELIPETDPTFIELARPASMYGRYHKSPRSLWFYGRWYLGSQAALAEGGESYATLRERFAVAQARLAEYPEDARVVVVTHSVFMTLFVEHLCREKPLWPWQAALAFVKILRTKNTHIIALSFDHKAPAGTCAWRREKLT
jgi:probable phosphoglycerate mutase